MKKYQIAIGASHLKSNLAAPSGFVSIRPEFDDFPDLLTYIVPENEIWVEAPSLAHALDLARHMGELQVIADAGFTLTALIAFGDDGLASDKESDDNSNQMFEKAIELSENRI